MRHLPTLLVVLPVLAALGLWCFPRRLVRAQQVYATIASTIVFVLSLFLLGSSPVDADGFLTAFRYDASWIPSLGISYSVGVDGISLFLVLLTTLLTPVAILSSFRAVEERVREYLVAFLLLEAAMVGTFVALDLFLFFLFWEAMLVPMSLIIGIWGGPRRVYAAVKFFLFTMVGSALMLVAILYVAYQHSVVHGSWSFDYFAVRDVMLPYGAQMLAFCAFTLAFAIKVPMWPLHTWLPDAHVEAPTAGSVILAAVLLKMGTYGYLRFSMGLFPYAATQAGPTIAAIAVVGIIFGALVAWKQRDVKKLVAYSSVSHLGFVMLGLAAADPRAVMGAMLQMLNHGISTGALFLLVGVVYERRHTRNLGDFGGLAAVTPMFAAVFMVITLSSIGLPGTNGFVGEFFVLLGSFQSEFLPRARWLVAFAGLGVILGAVYMLGMYLKMFFGPVKDPRNEGLADLSGREIACFAPLVVLVFAIGLFPGAFTKRMTDSVNRACVTYEVRVRAEAHIRMTDPLEEAASYSSWARRAAEARRAADILQSDAMVIRDAAPAPGEAGAAPEPGLGPARPAPPRPASPPPAVVGPRTAPAPAARGGAP